MILANWISPPTFGKEWLGWVADVLGIFGFIISVAGIVIAVLIKKEVSRAKREAEAKITNALQSQAESELFESKRFLDLAMESCRSKRWVRAEIHLDSTAEILRKLITAVELDDDGQKRMRKVIDDIRAVKETLRRMKNGQGDLSDENYALIDGAIEVPISMKGSLKPKRREDNT